MSSYNREDVIEEIKFLIKTEKGDEIQINPSLLEYFNDEDLVNVRDDLIHKKSNLRQENATWLNELYEKTKED